VRGRCGDNVRIDPSREAEAKILLDLYDKYVKRCIDYVLSGLVDGEMGEKLRQVIPISNIDMVKQLCSSLDAFLPAPSEGADRSEIEQHYIFSLVWSVGAALLGPSREKFDLFLRKVSLEALPDGLLYN
jgi:dynein heavy chain